MLRTATNRDFSLSLNIESCVAHTCNRTQQLLTFSPRSQCLWFSEIFPIYDHSKCFTGITTYAWYRKFLSRNSVNIRRCTLDEAASMALDNPLLRVTCLNKLSGCSWEGWQIHLWLQAPRPPLVIMQGVHEDHPRLPTNNPLLLLQRIRINR